MRYLLDTHVLLWALGTPERLDSETRAALEEPGNDVYFSAASIWEIAIKAGLGRADVNRRSGEVIHYARMTGFTELLLNSDAAARVQDLPRHHRDPFDRVLVAQAMAGPLRLITADPVLKSYSELVTLMSVVR